MAEEPARPGTTGALRRLLPDLQALRETEATRLVLVGVVIGLLAGLVAAAFDRGLVLVGRLLLDTAEPALHPPEAWRRALMPGLVALVSACILYFLTRQRRPLNVADVVGAVLPEQRPLSLRDAVPSALATLLAVASGHSGGRESPIVQLSGAVASKVCRVLQVRPSHFRTLVAAGSGAGIAASFNTPLGGAFFALEIILGGFAAETFAPVVAATVVATVVGQALLGDRVALHLPAFRLENAFELVPYAILGLVSAGLAAAFKRAVTVGQAQMARVPLHPILRTTLAGFGVGAIALGSSVVMGNGYAWIEALISGKLQLGVLALGVILLLKFSATVITSAGRTGAGLFAASLFMGAVTGTFVGRAAELLAPDLIGDPGAFGMVGMGAFAAAVLHAPVTLSLMLFEMTGNYEIVPPLLFANGIAALLNLALRSRSMLDLDLESRGLPSRQTRKQTALDRVRAADLLRAGGYETASPDTPVAALAARFLARPIDVVYLVDQDGLYRGRVDLQDIKPHLARPGPERLASQIATQEPPPLREETKVSQALRGFFRWEVDELPVLDEHGHLVGVLSERDVVAAWQSMVVREGELMAGFTSGSPQDRHTDFVELPHGQALDAVDVGPTRAGATLRELRLPQLHGITVVALSVYDPARGRWRRVAPDADRRLGADDRLIVGGPRRQIRMLKGEETITDSLIPEDEITN